MTDIHEGDEVLISASGIVTRVGPATFNIQTADKRNLLFGLNNKMTIEVTKRAEFELYVSGAYYMADDRVIYQYDSGDPFDSWTPGWYKWGGERVGFDVPKRPLRRMVPQDQGQSRGSDGF